jgi:uncharacterized protein YceK
MRIIALVILISIVSGGCVSVRSRMTSVNPGMSKDDVIAVMGQPGDRQFKDNLEAMQWCSTGGMADDYVVVWFQNGKVTGMNSYGNSSAGLCSNYYRQVRWEDAPTAAIEIRQR